MKLENARISVRHLIWSALAVALMLAALAPMKAFADVTPTPVGTALNLTIGLTSPDGTTTDQIPCDYKVIKACGPDGTGGELQIGGLDEGSFDPAIDAASEGSLVIPKTITSNGETWTVTVIGSSAFGDCVSLTGTGLAGSGVTTVDDDAFAGCDSLVDTGLAGSEVMTLGSGAFRNCASLKDTGLAGSKVTALFGGTFYNCKALSDTGLAGSKISTLGPSSFYECTSLVITGLEGSSVKTVGVSAFQGCTSLASAGLAHSNVEAVEEGAFQSCSALVSTGLENSRVKTLGTLAFGHCTSLAETGLAGSEVTTLGESAFINCAALTGTGLEGSKIESVGRGAFANCKNLVDTGLAGSKVKTVEVSAFALCSSLESVVLAEDSVLSTVEDMAFADCTSLESFVVTGKTAPAFSAKTFEGCTPTFALYYPVRVTGGTAAADRMISGSAPAGETVAVRANDPAADMQFDTWNVKAGGVTPADPTAVETTFVMPADYVELGATYKQASGLAPRPTPGPTPGSTVKPSLDSTPDSSSSSATIPPMSDAIDPTSLVLLAALSAFALATSLLIPQRLESRRPMR